MSSTNLPEQFSDLAPFTARWCRPTEDERWAARLACPMVEIQAFYDAFEPRAEEAIRYCDQFPLDGLPDEARNLLYLLCSLVEASFPVECWGQAKVPDTGAAEVNCILQPTL